MTVLYEDRFITVTSDALTIKRYFFPHGASKTIPAASIERVWRGTDPELGLNLFRKKTWGLALSNVWWALCAGREFNNDEYNFVVATQDASRFRHGFSVEDPAAASTALESIVPNHSE